MPATAKTLSSAQLRPVDKLDVIIKELDDSYESMSDMHAEGSATGFSKEPLD